MFSIKINDYILKKYQPQSKYFSYIAATSLHNLQRGKNNYQIQALDKQGNIIANLQHVVISDVRYQKLNSSGANTYIFAVIFTLILMLLYQQKNQLLSVFKI